MREDNFEEDNFEEEELYEEYLYFEYKDKWESSKKQLKEQADEIKRLNDIVNELEKYLIEEIEDYNKHINSQYITDIAREQYEGEKVCFEDMLGKLQELKEKVGDIQ